MFTIGIDVTIMCVIGLACIVGTAIFIWLLRLPEDYAQLVLGVASIVVAIMIVSYIVMACVLDKIIGIYW
jgi:bacteriorhodopsin